MKDEPPPIPVPPSPENALGELCTLLESVREKSEAAWIAVIERSGALVAQTGVDLGEEASVLAALAAGSFSASKELARRIGVNEFSDQLQEGDEGRILLSTLDEHLMCIAAFGPEAPLGLVRHYIRRNRIRLGETARAAWSAQSDALENFVLEPVLGEGPILA
jgi:predicted regulator of Ras-like GTPase activity (Roadblock/LC7/MglB family)